MTRLGRCTGVADELDAPDELDDVENHQNNAILDLLVDQGRVPVGSIRRANSHELPNAKNHQSETQNDEDGQVDEQHELVLQELVRLGQKDGSQLNLLAVAEEKDHEGDCHQNHDDSNDDVPGVVIEGQKLDRLHQDQNAGSQESQGAQHEGRIGEGLGGKNEEDHVD